MSNLYIENYLPAVRLTGGLKTKKPVTLSGTSATLTVGGTLSVTGAVTGPSISVTGAVTSRNATATPAAASAVAGLAMGADAIGVYWGTGSPSTALTAAKGSLFIRTDGSSTSTRLYVNTDGVTAWTNVTTAA